MLTSPKTARRLVAVTTWDEGYQQILCDCILQEVRKATYCSLQVVEVRCGEVADYARAVRRVAKRWWDAEDRNRVATYAEAMLRGDVFPPIIVDKPGGMLRDGYHRIAASRKAGIETIDVVYVYANAERFEDCLTVCDRQGVWSREGLCDTYD